MSGEEEPVVYLEASMSGGDSEVDGVKAGEETSRVRGLWERQAGRYDSRIVVAERLFFPGLRQWVCSRAYGEVLEPAVGTGRNFGYYPDGVYLHGVDLSPSMLEIARNRAVEEGLDGDLREGDAQGLPFAGESFDCVVCTLSLCSIPDHRKALAEMARVLRPGGRLLLGDHVRATATWLLTLQRALEPLAVRFEGEHLLRRPLDQVRELGLGIEESVRDRGGAVELLCARKPGKEPSDPAPDTEP